MFFFFKSYFPTGIQHDENCKLSFITKNKKLFFICFFVNFYFLILKFSNCDWTILILNCQASLLNVVCLMLSNKTKKQTNKKYIQSEKLIKLFIAEKLYSINFFRSTYYNIFKIYFLFFIICFCRFLLNKYKKKVERVGHYFLLLLLLISF